MSVTGDVSAMNTGLNGAVTVWVGVLQGRVRWDQSPEGGGDERGRGAVSSQRRQGEEQPQEADWEGSVLPSLLSGTCPGDQCNGTVTVDVPMVTNPGESQAGE